MSTSRVLALAFGRTLVPSVTMHYSSLLWLLGYSSWFPFLLFSFVCLVHLPLLVGWCFPFPDSLPLRFLSWIPSGCYFPGSCFLYPYLSSPWDSFRFSWRSSASVESPVPSATGSSLWAKSVVYWVLCAPSSSLVLSIPVERLCVCCLLLLSCSSSCLGSLYQWVFSSFGASSPSRLWVSLWGWVSVTSSPFCGFPGRCFTLVCLLLSSRRLLHSSGASLVLFLLLVAVTSLPVCHGSPCLGSRSPSSIGSPWLWLLR